MQIEGSPVRDVQMPLIRSSSRFLDLPIENCHQIICFASINDVAALSQTCKALYEAVYGREASSVWKALFLQAWDDPRIAIYFDSTPRRHSLNTSEAGFALAAIAYDWQSGLQDRIWAANLIRDRERAVGAKTIDRKRALKTFLSVIETTTPRNAHLYSPAWQSLDRHSLNNIWLQDLLEEAGALSVAVWPPIPYGEIEHPKALPDTEELELRNRLHMYIGLTEQDISISPQLSENGFISADDLGVLGHHCLESAATAFSRGESLIHPYELRSIAGFQGIDEILEQPSRSKLNLRTIARAYVYNIQNYKAANLYGPFMKDPNGGFKANWKHLEYIMIVCLMNEREGLEMLTIPMNQQPLPFIRSNRHPPTGLDALRPRSAPGFEEQAKAVLKWDAQREAGESPMIPPSMNRLWHDWDDWAGVEGKWMRIICFMDYHDLSQYNWPYNSRHRDVSVLEADAFQEAHRLISAEIRITSIETDPPPSRPLSATAIRLHRPRIFFAGVARSKELMSGINHSAMKGWVECLDSGDIRWHMVSSYGGGDRWSSEGIQIGGVGSARGVVGTWTGNDHDDRDPVGPYWFWKVEGKEGLPAPAVERRR